MGETFDQTFGWEPEVAVDALIFDKSHQNHIFIELILFWIANLGFDLILVIFTSLRPFFALLQQGVKLSHIFPKDVIIQMNQLDIPLLIDEEQDFFILVERIILFLFIFYIFVS